MVRKLGLKQIVHFDIRNFLIFKQITEYSFMVKLHYFWSFYDLYHTYYSYNEHNLLKNHQIISTSYMLTL